MTRVNSRPTSISTILVGQSTMNLLSSNRRLLSSTNRLMYIKRITIHRTNISRVRHRYRNLTTKRSAIRIAIRFVSRPQNLHMLKHMRQLSFHLRQVYSISITLHPLRHANSIINRHRSGHKLQFNLFHRPNHHRNIHRRSGSLQECLKRRFHSVIQISTINQGRRTRSFHIISTLTKFNLRSRTTPNSSSLTNAILNRCSIIIRRTGGFRNVPSNHSTITPVNS